MEDDGTPTVIVNGGEPLKDCPKDWDEAKHWQNEANDWSDGLHEVPEWKFDCGFKLDYDGPIVNILSRFYPPKTHRGLTWDGTVTVYVLGHQVAEKKFDCESLDELKEEVEKYVKNIPNIIGELIKKP